MAQHNRRSDDVAVAERELGLEFWPILGVDDEVVGRAVHASMPTTEQTNARIVASSRHAS